MGFEEDLCFFYLGGKMIYIFHIGEVWFQDGFFSSYVWLIRALRIIITNQ